MKSWIFGPGKAEIGLGTAIFGISASNYKGFRSSRPNPCPGDPFRDRLKMVVVVEGDGRWWWKVVVVESGSGGYQELQKLGRIVGRRDGVRACHPCFCKLSVHK